MFIELIKCLFISIFVESLNFPPSYTVYFQRLDEYFSINFNQRQILQNGPKQIYHEKNHLFMSVEFDHTIMLLQNQNCPCIKRNKMKL